MVGRHRFCSVLLCLGIFACRVAPTAAEPVVPGTGVRVTMVGDDFEAADWQYIPNGAKASYEQDETQRPPGGPGDPGPGPAGRVRRGFRHLKTLGYGS